MNRHCLLYTSDAADEGLGVDLGGRRIIKKISDSEDEFVDDSGYTISSQKTSDRSISTADIELANKINILKESGLI